MQVGDGDNFEAVMFKVLHHPLKVWEFIAVNGERTVVLLIVNVEVNDVSGNFSRTKFARDSPYARFRIIAVAALLVSQSEEWRQRRSPHQGGEVLDYRLRFRAIEKVVVEFTPVRTERVEIARLFSKIEITAISVVEKNSIG